MKCTRPHMCKECPFRKDSTPGWLGPWDSAYEFLHTSQSESGLACHMRLSLDGTDQENWERSHVCVGSVAFANHTIKRFRNPVLKEAQDKVRVLAKNILSSWSEFMAYHKDDDSLEESMVQRHTKLMSKVK